jgi:cystathionine beta-synthase
MNRVFQNVIQAIGNTPIVRLNKVLPPGFPANLYVKLEFMNPGGSIKDRIGHWLLDDCVKKGLLQPGGTIVEGTSGNTGVGLAIAAAVKGYKCIFVLPDKMSQEKIKNLRAFGAKVVVTPTAVEPEDPRSYYQVSRRLGRETPNAYYINQYDNLANRECHYQTTGPEILSQMPEIDAFVAGIGTGGTICGVGRYLKEKKPPTQIVAVDPKGSIVYDYFKTGKFETKPKTYKIEGIGEDFIPKNYDFSVIDDMVQVEDKESFLMTRELLTKEGLYCGISCGSAVVGAIRWVLSQGEKLRGKNVLVVLPDSGNRYLSKVYDDDWMKEAGFLEAQSLGTVSEMLRVVRKNGADRKVTMVQQAEKISSVIELFRDQGISQVPVRDAAGWIKGVVTEAMLLGALYQDRAKAQDPIEKIAATSVEFVSLEDSVEKVSRLLTQGKIPLVSSTQQPGEILDILTNIDVLTYMGSRS